MGTNSWKNRKNKMGKTMRNNVSKSYHPNGLAEEADMVTHNVLHSSGFFNGPGRSSIDNGSMEHFVSKWTNMNQKQNRGYKNIPDGAKFTPEFRGL